MKGGSSVRHRAAFLLALCGLMAAAVPAQRVSAWFTDRDHMENQTSIGGNRIEIEEEFTPPEKITPGSSVNKRVRIKNTGSTDCYARIMAVFSDSKTGQYCSPDWNTEDFALGDDGYYYYLRVLKPGELTPDLFTTITVSPDAPENLSGECSVLVYAESCQSDGFAQYSQAWEYFRRNRP